MPDLVQNHTMGVANAHSPLATPMQHHLHGRNDLHNPMSTVERHSYRGHQVDHLIRPSTENYSDLVHRSVLDMSNQHEQTDALHHVPGIIRIYTGCVYSDSLIIQKQSFI